MLTTMTELLAAPSKSLPQAHLSIEVWHTYASEVLRPNYLEDMFMATKSLINARVDIAKQDDPEATVNTVFLFDDENIHSTTKPSRYYQRIRDASQAVGLEIDYIAREAAFTKWGNYVVGMLKERQIPGTFDCICDSTGTTRLKITNDDDVYRTRYNQSIPLYTDGFDKKGHGVRKFSCPLLASLWQLERFGLFNQPMTPIDAGQSWPTTRKWHQIPEITQINPKAAPFHAKNILSILPKHFAQVESLGVYSINKILTSENLPVEYYFMPPSHRKINS